MVNASDLEFADGPGDHKNARLEFLTVAWDKNLKVAANSSHIVELSLPPEKYQFLMHNGLATSDELQLPPGIYSVTVGVMDDSSKKIGTLNIPLQISEPKKTSAK